MINEGGVSSLYSHQGDEKNAGEAMPKIGANKAEWTPNAGFDADKINKVGLAARLNPKSRLAKMEENALHEKKAALYLGSNINAVEKKKVAARMMEDDKAVKALGLHESSRKARIAAMNGLLGGRLEGYLQRKHLEGVGDAIDQGRYDKLKGLLPDKTISRLKNNREYRHDLLRSWGGIVGGHKERKWNKK